MVGLWFFVDWMIVRLFWLGNHTVPCLGFESEGASKVYIYCHANHDDMWRCSGMLRLVAATLKCHVVTFEYPGYGCAPGSADSENTVDSLHRLYDHLIHDRGGATPLVVLSQLAAEVQQQLQQCTIIEAHCLLPAQPICCCLLPLHNPSTAAYCLLHTYTIRDVELTIHAFSGFLPRDLMLTGRSIGSAIAVQFAAKYPVGVLILLTPFTSILDIVRHGEGSTWLQLLGHMVASVSPVRDCLCLLSFPLSACVSLSLSACGSLSLPACLSVPHLRAHYC